MPKKSKKGAARDGNGDTYYIPADMTYKEWKETFVDSGDKSGLRKVDKSRESDIIKLTEDELMALNRYISSDSYKINEKLRKGMELSEDDKKFIRDLDSALNKMPEYQGTVYRSVSSMGIDDVQKFINGYTPNMIKSFDEYISSGLEIYDESFPIQYVIKSKHGKDITKYNFAEQEILFKRNSKFKVIKVENNIIYMEEYENE